MGRGPILVPTDLSDGSVKACERAFALARAFDAPIELLHVWDLVEYKRPETKIVVAGVPGQTLHDYMLTVARTNLLAFEDALNAPDDVRLGRILRFGDARRVIPEVAADLDARCIVMGTHGRTGISRVFIGSVAAHVIRAAPCPVITVR